MNQIKSLGGLSYSDIPTLETPRLRLRPYKAADLDDMAAMWSNPDYVRFIGNRVRTRPELWKQIQSQIGSWALLGYGYWIVELKDRTFIGETGFLEALREMNPDHIGTPEAGWGITPAHWGQGYASEALSAIHNWSDAHFTEKRTVCMIEPEHATSIRLAEKYGYRRVYEAVLGDDPISVFERMG